MGPPVPSRMRLVASVVACTTRVTSPASAPDSRRTLAMPSSTAITGSSGVVGTLTPTTVAPSALAITTSVNVPPMSAPIAHMSQTIPLRNGPDPDGGDPRGAGGGGRGDRHGGGAGRLPHVEQGGRRRQRPHLRPPRPPGGAVGDHHVLPRRQPAGVHRQRAQPVRRRRHGRG